MATKKYIPKNAVLAYTAISTGIAAYGFAKAVKATPTGMFGIIIVSAAVVTGAVSLITWPITKKFTV